MVINIITPVEKTSSLFVNLKPGSQHSGISQHDALLKKLIDKK